MSRLPLVAGNWKLHNTIDESVALVRALLAGLVDPCPAEVVVVPVYTSLHAVVSELRGTRIAVGAQDVYWEDGGAFTGEVSAPLLRDAGCRYVIVGHSERRQLFGERDEDVQRKAQAVLAQQMTPIVCIGETAEERDTGRVAEVIERQLGAALAGSSPEQALRTVVAYEPVWAIGTGRTARAQDAQQVHGQVRALLREQFGAEVAEQLRILYGGSVKPDNAAALMAEPDIDGALVGGASLSASSFLSIVGAAI